MLESVDTRATAAFWIKKLCLCSVGWRSGPAKLKNTRKVSDLAALFASKNRFAGCVSTDPSALLRL